MTLLSLILLVQLNRSECTHNRREAVCVRKCLKLVIKVVGNRFSNKMKLISFLVVRCCITLVVKRFVNVAKFYPTSVGGTGAGGKSTAPFRSKLNIEKF